MAGNSLSLVWDLIARDGASPVFDRVSASADKAAASTEAASAKVSSGFSTAAKAGAAAGVVFAAASIKMAADFQSSTVRLVTSANESQKNLKMVQQGMLDMAGQLGYSTTELSAAMYKVESGGQHGAAGLATLKAAAQGAKTENADLTTVADALTSAMTDYHLKASDAATVTSKLVAATASGKMTFEELAGSLSAILPVASANHVALNDILGDLASMTMHGMSAEQASQNLADAIRHLAAPTQQQQKEFAALGLTAQQITADLGTKGLSGTINVIGDAIKAQMGGPTSQVVLDLNTALSKLPAPVKALGQSILDGTLSLGDYRKAMKALPAEQAIAAQSFMGLVSSTHQIGNETKNGAEIYQSYSGALRQALGDATGMNVALMIGGENAGNTAKAIANVSRATADAKGNVQGWSEIQGTFNQQASETLHSLEAMTISAGMHLLPAMTSLMGFVNRDAIPAIKGLASGASDAIHWWSQLPAPIKDVTAALGLMAAANALGITAKIGAGFTTLRASAAEGAGALKGFGDEMRVQQSLAAMESASLSQVDRALGATAASADVAAASLSRVQMMQRGWDVNGLQAMAPAEESAAAGAGKLESALATAQIRGVAGMKAGISGLVNMLGGPWMIATAGAVLGVMAIKNAIDQHDEAVKRATQDVQGWDKALALSSSGQTSMDAQRHLADLAKQIDDTKTKIGQLSGATDGGAAKIGIYGFHVGTMSAQVESGRAHLTDLHNELKNGQKAWDAQLASMSPVEVAEAKVTQATQDLNAALRNNPAGSLAVTTAADRLSQAQANLAYQTGLANDASKTELQRLQDLANAQLGAVSSGLAAKQSYDEFIQTLIQYRESTQHSAVETDGLAQAAIGSAAAAGQAGESWAKANHVSDTAAASNYAQLLSLQKVANAMGQDTPLAVSQQISALQRAVAQGGLTAAQMDAITRSINGIPKDPRINVSADVSAAQAQIDGLLRGYQHVQYTGSAIVVNGRVIANAEGNLLPMSATQASVVRPGALRVIGDNPVADEAFIPINNSSRSMSILGETASRMGMGLVPMANGGFWNMGERFPAHPSQSMLDSVKAAGASLFPSFTGGGGAGSPLMRLLGASIAASMGYASQFNAIDYIFSHESGWNPMAQNPTSTAFGIPQFLNSTWGAYGGKTTDAARQIRDGISYMRDRYGSPNSAAAFWQAHHWYKNGTNFVPSDQLAMLHKGEAVVPADKNQGAPFVGGGPMQITGTLDLGNGLVGVVRGEIAGALSTVRDRMAYNS